VKKSVAAILVLMMIAMFGCGVKEEVPVETPTPTPTPTAIATPTPTPTPEPTPTESPPSMYELWREFRGNANANGLRNASSDINLLFDGTSLTFNADFLDVADFDGDGKEDTFTINVSRDWLGADDEDSNYNKPVRVIVKIRDAEVVYEDYWNDGVKMAIADFDSEDKFVEFYIYSSGTDVSGDVKIYRYDGEKIVCIARIGSDYGLPVYDGKGKIYTFSGWFGDEFINRADFFPEGKDWLGESCLVYDLRTMTADFFEI
jgi:hypothetical protein